MENTANPVRLDDEDKALLMQIQARMTNRGATKRPSYKRLLGEAISLLDQKTRDPNGDTPTNKRDMDIRKDQVIELSADERQLLQLIRQANSVTDPGVAEMWKKVRSQIEWCARHANSRMYDAVSSIDSPAAGSPRTTGRGHQPGKGTK